MVTFFAAEPVPKVEEGEEPVEQQPEESQPDEEPIPAKVDDSTSSTTADTPNPVPKLDLCFICDCTGSMGQYIKAAQENIREIVTKVSENEDANVRFGLVSYRDHPPQDATYVTKVFPFTPDLNEMKTYVDTMSAAGGGDGPEAVTAGLDDALSMPWREDAAKVAVLIADAPPHGLEPSGDGFPNGDPLGRDPLDILRRMANAQITCYSVGCEPALGTYRFARDFMCTVAEITGGHAVALSSAALLADVIIGGSTEEISMMRLQREVETEIDMVQRAARERSEVLADEECARRATANLQSRKVATKQMQCDGEMQNANFSIWHKKGDGARGGGAAVQSLAGVKADLCTKGGCTSNPVGVSSMSVRSAPKSDGMMSMLYAGAKSLIWGSESSDVRSRSGGMSMYYDGVSKTKHVVESEDLYCPPPAMSASVGSRPQAMTASVGSRPQVATKAEVTNELISEMQVVRLMKKMVRPSS